MRDYANSYAASPLSKYTRLRAYVTQTFEEVAYGTITPAQAAKTLLNEGNALLEKIQ